MANKAAAFRHSMDFLLAWNCTHIAIINANIMSKKDTTIGVRVDDDLYSIIQSLAAEDDRPIASMARKLIVEALETRKILKKTK